MRRRLSLACALVHKPESLFLDEPTVGIDPALRVEFWNYFRRLAGEGTTILVSSHVMDEADRCDELLLILHGKLSGAWLGRGDPPAGRACDDGGCLPQARRHGEVRVSLRRTLAISRRIAEQFRRDERTLALLFVAPIVILALLGWVIRDQAPPPGRVAIVNQAGPLAELGGRPSGHAP